MYDEQPDGDPHGECAAEIHRLEASLASAQQRIEELERALGELVALQNYVDCVHDGTARINLPDYIRRFPAAWAAARALVAPTRPDEPALSKAYLSGKSPQSAWPFDLDAGHLEYTSWDSAARGTEG